MDFNAIASTSYVIIDYPVLDLWLGFAAFFLIFFAVVFYFKRNKTVLSNTKK